MAPKSIVLHSALAPEAIAATLRWSIDSETDAGVAVQSLMPWFVRLVWKGGSRQVRGLLDGNTFRLKSRNAWQLSPNFYGKWQSESGGTRIEGYFALAPLVKFSIRITFVVTLGFAVVGIVLNTLDLEVGTHFTVDPEIGLWISLLLVPFALGIYLLARRIGSRGEEGLLRFVEQTLAANRVC
jgi:hypothetical protein